MNKSVPTLLGIIIILLVVVLVVLIYDYKLTSGLATGRVAGTVGGQLLTGVQQPGEDIGVGEVLEGRAQPDAVPSPAGTQTRGAELSREAKERRAAREQGETPEGELREGVPRPSGP